MGNMNRLLLFDYDGVIVDSLPVIVDVYNKLFRKHGLDLNFTAEEFSMFYVGNFHKGLAEKVPKGALPIILKEKGEEFIKRNNEFRLFKGIKGVLEKLSEKAKIIIISSNTTEAIKKSMELNGIDFIEDVIGGDIEPSKVKKILAQKEKHPDAETYYIGDTLGDIKEAKKAGVKSVAVTWGFHNKQMLEKEGPDYLFDDVLELLGLV